jgi:hypothetical protein
VLLATRLCTGMGSNRAARSARYLLSACALVVVVSHATAFLSQITFDSLLSRGLSTRGQQSAVRFRLLPSSFAVPVPPPLFFFFQNRQPAHRAHREYRHRARSFLTAFVIYSIALRSLFFLHSGRRPPWGTVWPGDHTGALQRPPRPCGGGRPALGSWKL